MLNQEFGQNTLVSRETPKASTQHWLSQKVSRRTKKYQTDPKVPYPWLQHSTCSLKLHLCAQGKTPQAPAQPWLSQNNPRPCQLTYQHHHNLPPKISSHVNASSGRLELLQSLNLFVQLSAGGQFSLPLIFKSNKIEMVLRSCSYSEGNHIFPSQVPQVEFQNRAVRGKSENNPNMVFVDQEPCDFGQSDFIMLFINLRLHFLLHCLFNLREF